MNKWWLLIGGAVAIYYYRVYRAAKALGFGMGVPQNISLKGGGLSFVIPLRVTNGSATAVPLSSVSITNYIGSTEIGYTLLQKPVWIAPRTRTDVPLSVNVPFASLISAGVTLYNQIREKEVQMTFRGSVSSLGVNVPIDQVIGVNFKGFL